MYQFSSVYQLWPHGLQHTRLPCPSPIPRACSNPCTSSQWCHPTISSSVIPFSFCLQSFQASGSVPMSQFFASSDQSIGVSASTSVFPMNIQCWFPLGLIAFNTEDYKKDLHDPDYHDGVISDLEPDILECKVWFALASLRTKLVEVMVFQLSYFKF